MGAEELPRVQTLSRDSGANPVRYADERAERQSGLHSRPPFPVDVHALILDNSRTTITSALGPDQWLSPQLKQFAGQFPTKLASKLRNRERLAASALPERIKRGIARNAISDAFSNKSLGSAGSRQWGSSLGQLCSYCSS